MALSNPIRVIVIDDHSHTHKAVAIALQQADDIVLVAHGGNGQEALQLCEEYQPDIVLMDVVMPNMDGVEATRHLQQTFPDIRILVLSSFQDDDSIQSMLKNGAAGYVLKGSLAADLVNTIRSTFAGNAVFSPEIAQTLIQQTEKHQNFGLTEREREVLKLMAAGQNNGEIAAKLFISQSTVKFHLVNILHKMRVETRAEAIVLAAKNHLV